MTPLTPHDNSSNGDNEMATNRLDRTADYYARQRVREFRRHLQSTYGRRCYRWGRNGAVHAYGTLPNTNAVGWYFAGRDTDIARAGGLDLPPADCR